MEAEQQESRDSFQKRLEKSDELYGSHASATLQLTEASTMRSLESSTSMSALSRSITEAFAPSHSTSGGRQQTKTPFRPLSEPHRWAEKLRSQTFISPTASLSPMTTDIAEREQQPGRTVKARVKFSSEAIQELIQRMSLGEQTKNVRQVTLMEGSRKKKQLDQILRNRRQVTRRICSLLWLKLFD